MAAGSGGIGRPWEGGRERLKGGEGMRLRQQAGRKICLPQWEEEGVGVACLLRRQNTLYFVKLFLKLGNVSKTSLMHYQS